VEQWYSTVLHVSNGLGDRARLGVRDCLGAAVRLCLRVGRCGDETPLSLAFVGGSWRKSNF